MEYVLVGNVKLVHNNNAHTTKIVSIIVNNSNVVLFYELQIDKEELNISGYNNISESRSECKLPQTLVPRPTPPNNFMNNFLSSLVNRYTVKQKSQPTK